MLVSVSEAVNWTMPKRLHTLSAYAERRSSRSVATSLLFSTTRCEPITSKCKMSVSAGDPHETKSRPEYESRKYSSLTVLPSHPRKSLPDWILWKIKQVTDNRVSPRTRWIGRFPRSPFLPYHSEKNCSRNHSQSWADVFLRRGRGHGKWERTGSRSEVQVHFKNGRRVQCIRLAHDRSYPVPERCGTFTGSVCESGQFHTLAPAHAAPRVRNVCIVLLSK